MGTFTEKLLKEAQQVFEGMQLHSHGLREMVADPASIWAATLSIGKNFETLKTSLEGAFIPFFEGYKIFIPELEALQKFAKDNRLDESVVLNNVEVTEEGFVYCMEYAHGRISDLSALAYLSTLETLSLQSNQIQDLSPLSNLKQLNSLNLASNQITDLSPLESIESLGDLTLSSNQIANITSLTSLANLERLIIDKNPVKNLAPLRACSKLTMVQFDYRKGLDLGFLKELGSLEWVGVCGKEDQINSNPILQQLQQRKIQIIKYTA